MYQTLGKHSDPSKRATGLATVATVGAVLAVMVATAKMPEIVTTMTTPTLVVIEEKPMPPAPAEPLPLTDIDAPPLPVESPLPFEPTEFVYDKPVITVAPTEAPPRTVAPPVPRTPAAPATAASMIRGRDLPHYPSASIRANESGPMTLEVCVSSSGRVQSASVVKSTGYPRLDEAALKWMRQQRFTPARSNGVSQAQCGVLIDYLWDLKNAR
ncbi:MAG: energy transducer TonB [Hyphomonadaceae bacterium]